MAAKRTVNRNEPLHFSLSELTKSAASPRSRLARRLRSLSARRMPGFRSCSQGRRKCETRPPLRERTADSDSVTCRKSRNAPLDGMHSVDARATRNHAKRLPVSSDSRKVLTFSLGGEVYGVDILPREGNPRLVAGHAHSAIVAPSVLGVLNLRGVIVPIVDLRVRFALAAAEFTPITVIIVLSLRTATGLREVRYRGRQRQGRGRHLEPTTSSPRLSGRHGHTSEYIDGIAAHDEQMLILLNAESLASVEQFLPRSPTGLPSSTGPRSGLTRTGLRMRLNVFKNIRLSLQLYALVAVTLAIAIGTDLLLDAAGAQYPGHAQAHHRQPHGVGPVDPGRGGCVVAVAGSLARRRSRRSRRRAGGARRDQDGHRQGARRLGQLFPRRHDRRTSRSWPTRPRRMLDGAYGKIDQLLKKLESNDVADLAALAQ